jgi:hypothetical protein
LALPFAFISQMRPCAAYAIRRPLGDHAGAPTNPTANRVFRLPSLRIFQIDEWPELSDEYAIQRLSADQAGAPSLAPLRVSLRTCEPFERMT